MGVIVQLLGPLRALRDGRDVTPTAGKQRVVLAALALAGGSVSLEQLVDVVWGETPPSSARVSLRVYVARLREALGEDVIETTDAGYRLSPESSRVDVAELDAVVVAADAAETADDVEGAARSLRAALGMWRGEPLTNVPSEALRQRVASSLVERRLQLVERRCELEIRLGRAGEVIVELRGLVDDHPLREAFWVGLMRALYAAGRQAEALSAYHEVAGILAEQLGVDPSEDLRRTHQAILDRTLVPAAPGEEVDTSRVESRDPPAEVPRQLPAPPPAFTGRQRELAEIDREHDADTVVITAIDGMAGIGKTALAVHAAHRIADRYPDGQLFVDLHGYTPGMTPVDPGDALTAVLHALGVPGDRIPTRVDERAAMYRSRLAGKRMLVVLDNAESEGQVRPLLPGDPSCRVLVTSRRRLGALDTLHTVSLDLLPSPDSVTLFTRAAGDRRLGAEPDALVVETVDLCGRLPLAIRLAAARLRSHPTWTLANLVDRLREHQHRLGELGTGHRGVDSALDLSYQHLPDDQQRAYRRLSLHVGHDIDAYATAALVGAELVQTRRLLDQLLDNHLLEEPLPGRYSFHDLARIHAAGTARATDTESDRRAALTRLFDHYRHTASTAMDAAYPYERERRPRVPPVAVPVPDLSDPTVAVAWLDTELANLLAVAEHAAGGGCPQHTVDLSGILHRHLRTDGRYHDAEALHRHALTAARTSGDPRGEAYALASLGNVHEWHTGLDEASDYYQQALHVARSAGHRTGEMYALNGLAGVRRQQGRHDESADRCGRALEIARGIGHRQGELEALHLVGTVHLVRTEYEEAAEHYQQAFKIAQSIGHEHEQVNALLGHTHRLLGHYDDAAHYYGQVLQLIPRTGYHNSQFEALQGLGRLHHTTGRPRDALTHHQQALTVATELQHPGDQARAHDGLAHAHLALDQPEAARRHWQRALQILTSVGTVHTDEADVTIPAIRSCLADLDQVGEPH